MKTEIVFPQVGFAQQTKTFVKPYTMRMKWANQNSVQGSGFHRIPNVAYGVQFAVYQLMIFATVLII